MNTSLIATVAPVTAGEEATDCVLVGPGSPLQVRDTHAGQVGGNAIPVNDHDRNWPVCAMANRAEGRALAEVKAIC